MNNKPMPLTDKEIRQIASLKAIQQMWGAESVEDMVDMLRDQVYAVKFSYVSGGPGYVGDYYILQGDALNEPLQLIRDAAGQVVVL